MIEELRLIRQLLERQAAPVVQEQVRQLLTASPEQVKAHNKDVLARARSRAQVRSLSATRGKQ